MVDYADKYSNIFNNYSKSNKFRMAMKIGYGMFKNKYTCIWHIFVAVLISTAII